MISWIWKFLDQHQPPRNVRAAQRSEPAVPAGDPAEAQPEESLPVPAELLATALRQEGYRFVREGERLLLDGLEIRIELIAFEPAGERMRWRTETEVRHPRLGEQPIREYQMGQVPLDGDFSDMTETLRHWCLIDLAVLCDALREVPESMQYMKIDVPASTAPDAPSHRYRVLFSRVQFLQQEPAPEDEEKPEHEFCDCCLFTRSLEGLMPLLREGGVVPLRLFAARDADGSAMADCRVNGEDYEPGQQSLLGYIATWPPRGFEYRKQFVLAQPLPE